MGGFAIPTGTAGFLIIAFHIFRQVPVKYKSYVGFIDPHTEGYGGHDHLNFIAVKLVLIILSLQGREPCVIG